MSAYFIAQVQVADESATQIVEAAEVDRLVFFRSLNANTMYLGFDNGVSTSTGFSVSLASGQPPIPLPAGRDLWAFMDDFEGGTVQIYAGPQH